ncbi:hypothetical protein SCHPADRAFT_992186 [Schizopora paradoxa]|uniref:DUF6593 domain-containing protein n=1 Tax=Schizopora paradoxa TaxID=27342 RepID=A0A0H2SSI9_9AGAM|nr:hypothetical protein SCHPADRAFT_992186 [Schizopora paradoxa]
MQETSPTLELSSDDLLNTSFDSEKLGVHYKITTSSSFLGTSKTTDALRKDNQSEQYEIVAQWHRRTLHKDTFKFYKAPSGGNAEGEASVTKFMTKKDGLSTLERTFVGDDERNYTWVVKGSQLDAHLVEGGKRSTPVASFHRRALFGSENAYLELMPGYEGTLDSIVVTFLYTEWKRRESGRSQDSSQPSPPSAVGLGAATATTVLNV